MKKISAPTLQNALSQAALEFGCSVTELEYEVIQYESKGIFGLFKKPAIIIANSTLHSTQAPYNAPQQRYKPNATDTATGANASPNARAHGSEEFFDASAFLHDDSRGEVAQNLPQNLSKDSSQHDHAPSPHSYAAQTFQPQFQTQFQTKEEVLQEITSHIKEMLSFMPYQIKTIQVSFYDPQTLYIYLDGADSALLIGERGYRYKALSYLLFNWIQPAYGYNIRLEIAQFLQNQEEAIDAYLVGIINEVRREGKAQTKPLDGILAFIALKKLREQLPDKYISFRQNAQNERYIVINDFYH